MCSFLAFPTFPLFFIPPSLPSSICLFVQFSHPLVPLVPPVFFSLISFLLSCHPTSLQSSLILSSFPLLAPSRSAILLLLIPFLPLLFLHFPSPPFFSFSLFFSELPPPLLPPFVHLTSLPFFLISHFPLFSMHRDHIRPAPAPLTGLTVRVARCIATQASPSTRR